MTEQYYQYPGDVREAMNFQCLHCNKIFTAPQGLDGHLTKVHKIDLRNFQYKKDWDITTETAGDYTPIVDRKPSTTISGDRRMKSKQEKTHNLECIVQGCGVIYSSSAGMSVHQIKAHGQGSRKDVNWRWSLKPTTINDLRSRAAQERKGIRTTAAAEPEERLNYKCLVTGCGQVVKSLPGIIGHLRRKHNQGARKSVNWERVKEPATQKGRDRTPIAAPAEQPQQPRAKRPYARRQPQQVVVTPDSTHIEIAATIRVPISVGQAEIITQEN